MNITKSKLENVTELGTVDGVSHYGTGFLTAIVGCFVEIFGRSNPLLEAKITKAKNSAKEYAFIKATEMGADGIMDYEIQLSGRTVLVYGTAYKNGNTIADNALPEL